MPFHTLSSGGLSILCFYPEHDWNHSVDVSHYFAADVTAGLSNREERTPGAEAVLLSVALSLWLEEEEAQATRQAFATLGTGWVGFPIVADSFLGADAATAGKRVYSSQKLLNLTTPEIVASTDTLNAGDTYAPLVVGHITDLPPIEPESGSLARCDVLLTEDSPWEFRLGSVATESAGAFPTALLPDWTSPPSQTPVKELDFERIGQARESVIGQQERAFRWTQRAGFTLTSKSEIASLLAFFIASRGRVKSFDAPFFYAPGDATAEAPHESKFRFADASLRISFSTTSLASAEVGFEQVPWEIEGVDGEEPEQAPRIYLYQFTYAVPSPVVYRFTNCWRSLTRASDGTYTPAPMQHDEIVAGLTLKDEKLTLESFAFTGNPLALFEADAVEGPLWLRVYEVESDPLDPDSATLVWVGRITKAPQTGRRFSAVGEWMGGLLSREVPNVRIGPNCNTYFTSSRCGHEKSSFAKSCTLTTSVGNVVTVAISDAAAANTYSPGLFEVGSGLTYESRSITSSEPISGGQQLTLDRPLRQSASGQAATYYSSCDRTVTTCQALDPSGWKARFRGHPNLPQVNLSLPSITSNSGGKK